MFLDRRPLVFLLCAFLTGCASNSSDKSASPAPAVQLAITAPADNAVLTATPVTISINVANADPAGLQVLLDGTDISTQFSAANSSGTRMATVTTPAVNLGKNQLLVSDSTASANSQFFIEPQSSSAAAAALPLLIPIKTRVLRPNTDGTNPTDYGIAVYTDPSNPSSATTFYASAPSDGSNTGFQILFLKRTDLSMVSNTTVPNPFPTGGVEFFSTPLFKTAYNTPSQCGPSGCLKIIQSLGTIGLMPCTNTSDTSDCTNFAGLLNQLGLTARLAYANGSNKQIAFSAILNAPVAQAQPGLFFESLTCSGNNYNGPATCDSLGYPNTSFTASTDATPDQIGNISGALIRDNFNNYTFAQNAPWANFAFKTSTGPLSHTITVNGTDYTTSSLNGAPGGFHLLILNSKDLSVEQNATFPTASDGSEVTSMMSLIDGYKSFGNLFFLAAFGNTEYAATEANRDTWVTNSSVIYELGGTRQVFYLVNDPEFSPRAQDDYSLVGSFQDGTLTAHPYYTGVVPSVYAAELSSVISRETESIPQSSNMEGMLTLNNQGYYAVSSYGHNFGVMTLSGSQVLSASLQPPTPWPYTGDTGKQNAYNWISAQLCCADIRSAYVNLNVSPAVWLTELQTLTYDPANIPNSSQADFDAMVQQLSTEFEYVVQVRLFESNTLALYQDQQSNISLLLQEDASAVEQNLNVDFSNQTQPVSWISMLEGSGNTVGLLVSFLGPEGMLAGTGIRSAVSIATLLGASGAIQSNSPAGTPLPAQENEEIAVSQIASTAANEFSTTLISIGGEFDRVVSDWGRLKTMGGPLEANLIPWNGDTEGLLLQSFDRLYQKELYAKLMQANVDVQYTPFSSVGPTPEFDYTKDRGELCDVPDFVSDYPQLLLYPGLMKTNYSSFPTNYTWDLYQPVYKQYADGSCPPTTHPVPGTFGLFEPLDPVNSNALGAYRYWFYTRSGFTNVTNNDLLNCWVDQALCS